MSCSREILRAAVHLTDSRGTVYLLDPAPPGSVLCGLARHQSPWAAGCPGIPVRPNMFNWRAVRPARCSPPASRSLSIHSSRIPSTSSRSTRKAGLPPNPWLRVIGRRFGPHRRAANLKQADWELRRAKPYAPSVIEQLAARLLRESARPTGSV